MCEKLPMGGFKLTNIEEYTEEKVTMMIEALEHYLK